MSRMEEGFGLGRTAPTVLLIGDGPSRTAELAEAVVRAGARPLDAMAASGTAACAVVAQLGGEIGPAAEALFERIEATSRRQALPGLLLIPHAAIDAAFSATADSRIRILVEPGPAEFAAALAELLAPPAPAVGDPAGEQARELARLSDEAARIARALARLAQEEAGAAAPAGPASAEQVAIARLLLRLRRLRGQFFRPSPFADPAWDMLLDLTVARAEGHRVAVSSLCIAAGVPATTALRWIAALTERGLLARAPDPADRRRAFVVLTEPAATAMAGYCAAAARMIAAAAGDGGR